MACIAFISITDQCTFTGATWPRTCRKCSQMRLCSTCNTNCGIGCTCILQLDNWDSETPHNRHIEGKTLQRSLRNNSYCSPDTSTRTIDRAQSGIAHTISPPLVVNDRNHTQGQQRTTAQIVRASSSCAAESRQGWRALHSFRQSRLTNVAFGTNAASVITI